jgi:hypothetical protein
VALAISAALRACLASHRPGSTMASSISIYYSCGTMALASVARTLACFSPSKEGGGVKTAMARTRLAQEVSRKRSQGSDRRRSHEAEAGAGADTVDVSTCNRCDAVDASIL